MAKAPTSYAGNLARAIGQGVTFGFGDEIEAGIRSLGSDRSYDEEVADIRESIEQFRETNPVAAYGSEIVGSIPTGLGLAGLALRGGLKGAAKIGALEGGIYGAGEGEGVEGTATSAVIGAGLGGALGKAGEKAFEGIAPLVGKFMKKTRGSGTEVKGSGNIEMDSSPSNLGPMVRDLEAGSDEFVPLEKKVGEFGTPGPDRSINKPLEDERTVMGASATALGGIDYLPVANALLDNTVGAGKKGLTGAQYLARLKNQPSVTDLEMEVSGLDKFLAENSTRKISVDDVLNYHVENSPKIEMVDGGARHVSDQRMFGDESFAAQNVGGGYEEIVFRDARFVGNRDTAPGAMHDATHHTNVEGGIGHGRMTSFDDVATGGERSTMLEENQSDLWSIYKGKNRPDEDAQKFVQLTPDKVKSFKAIDEKIEDSSKYRTLNDAFNERDQAENILKELDQEADTVGQNIKRLEARTFFPRSGTDLRAPQIANVEFNKVRQNGFKSSVVDKIKSSLPGIRPDPAASYGVEQMLQREVGRILYDNKGKVVDRLTDDEVAKAIELGLNRQGIKKVDDGLRADEDVVKEALGIPLDKRLDVTQENKIVGFNTVMLDVAGEIGSKADKTVATASSLNEISYITLDNIFDAVSAEASAVARNIRVDGVRKQITEYNTLLDKRDLLKSDREIKTNEIKTKKDRVMNIYGDAIEDAAPNKQTAFEYLHYRQNQGKLAVDGASFNNLSQRFSQDPKRVAERGFGDPAPNFTNPLPFETQDQVARYQLHQMIKKAAADGSTRFYIPDYRDLASKRIGEVFVDEQGNLRSTVEGMEKELAPYVSRYKTPQEKVIKELKEMYPGIDIGTVDTVQPVLKDPLGNVAKKPDEIPFSEGMTREDYELRVRTQQENFKTAQPEHEFPMTYIDLTPLQAKPSQVRRYKRGGKVDMRSGIGDLFKVYS